MLGTVYLYLIADNVEREERGDGTSAARNKVITLHKG